ncbi:MAG: hypothetical protein K0S45_3637 [Nitrospira sp.]|jgi:hypothetical protein|nr:hypothetical protein [Nitrospira sp.]
MPPKRAAVVSASAIAKSVESAVRIATARHDLAVDKETFLDRWEIIGRRLRDANDMNLAYKFAEDVTRSVKVSGLTVDPVVTKIRGDILVGFIERNRTPKLITG